ncbi:alkaline phosphatase [Pelodictyon luteolum]|uniref:Alkaline phosphatase n=1 Tax=Chlorobium luteolum (strain DSM 273 / BCRC 81028 / 2530) TaxID=319225 RepID=Q3B154_CHLL3|nr:alkaline phosphatase [Pelodictyon luteolum]ABB24927.1 Alkaline phosphatase [Pelodictyon luteolum DSM 273]
MQRTWITLSLLLLLLPGCSVRNTAIGDAVETSVPTAPPARHVFLFIGDGMGLAQVELARALLPEGDSLAMTSLPVTGLVSTHALDHYITDSAAAGTALATGHGTMVGTIAMGSNRLDTLKTIVEIAETAGMRTGIVTSVGIDNATPACFYAHSPSRTRIHDIASQMVGSGVDYFAGGYAEGNFPLMRARAELDYGDIDSLMLAGGYRIARNARELREVQPGKPVWAYGQYGRSAAMAFAMDADSREMDLAAYTGEGIRLLENPKGFFMMVEGGKIDWACHGNDAAAVAHDVASFDRAVRQALAFYRSHPSSTLIVVTADHECGGLSLGNTAGGYESRPRLLLNQKLSLERFMDKVALWRSERRVTFPMALDSLEVFFGLGSPRDSALVLSARNRRELQVAFTSSMAPFPAPDRFSPAVSAILNRRAGIGWGSRVHTAVPVPVFAIGAHAGMFSGSYPNTVLGQRLMQAAGFSGATDPHPGEFSPAPARSAP